MLFVPLNAVNNIHFGATSSEVEALLGEPVRRSTDRMGRVELHFGSAIYRFSGESLEEVTIEAPVVSIATVAIPFHHLADYLRENDPACFERVGFIISPAYGLAHDPQFACWVTAFPTSLVELWRSVDQ